MADCRRARLGLPAHAAGATAGSGAHPAALAASVARPLPRVPYIGFRTAGFPAQVRPETVSGKDANRRQRVTVCMETMSGSTVSDWWFDGSHSQKRRFRRWAGISRRGASTFAGLGIRSRASGKSASAPPSNSGPARQVSARIRQAASL